MESSSFLRWAMTVSFSAESEVTEDVILLLPSVYKKYALRLIKCVWLFSSVEH